jgi:hypothetical protein
LWAGVDDIVTIATTGVQWSSYGTVGQSYGSPAVAYGSPSWAPYLIVFMRKGQPLDGGAVQRRLLYATSSDGVTWSAPAPILVAGQYATSANRPALAWSSAWNAYVLVFTRADYDYQGAINEVTTQEASRDGMPPEGVWRLGLVLPAGQRL